MREGIGATLLALIAVFAPLSLLSFGGSNAVMADIAQQTINIHHWTTEREFADLFALSRAAPGPGSMLTALIGWKVAGVAGALTATLALYAPGAILVFAVSRVWYRWRGSRWHSAVERGLAPIAAGLFLSGGLALLRAEPAGWPVWAAAALTTVVLLRWPKLNPLLLLLAGALLFAVVPV
ncbi:MAG: chromate transporter [Alphaproteobacteria bacterium]|nr:chromate transporter [Alphaproteobacteria bacterium]